MTFFAFIRRYWSRESERHFARRPSVFVELGRALGNER